jgi:hypothetical protein
VTFRRFDAVKIRRFAPLNLDLFTHCHLEAAIDND